MAIQIEVKKDNGIVLNYHHIAMVTIEVNQCITLLIRSYLDQESRQYTKDYADGKIEGEPTFPYTDAEYITIDWKDIGNLLNGDIMTNVYNWLKNRPEYTGATDV